MVTVLLVVMLSILQVGDVHYNLHSKAKDIGRVSFGSQQTYICIVAKHTTTSLWRNRWISIRTRKWTGYLTITIYNNS